jgi:hypothetical protein
MAHPLEVTHCQKHICSVGVGVGIGVGVVVVVIGMVRCVVVCLAGNLSS